MLKFLKNIQIQTIPKKNSFFPKENTFIPIFFPCESLENTYCNYYDGQINIYKSYLKDFPQYTNQFQNKISKLENFKEQIRSKKISYNHGQLYALNNIKNKFPEHSYQIQSQIVKIQKD